MSTTGLAKRFDVFVESLLTKSGINMTRNSNGGFDFFGVSEVGTRAVIEVKLYSSGSVSPALLQSAAASVVYAAQKNEIPKSILVTNVIVQPGIKQELFNSLGVIVYDYAIISGLASNHLDLAEEWERIIGLTRIFRSDYGAEVNSISNPIDPIKAFDAPLAISFGLATQLQPAPNKGGLLADEIENISTVGDLPTRKKAAVEFENKCTEALKYVFSEDLVAWCPQPRSDNGLNRYDLIARTSSDEDFWQCLVRDFRARYIIFEFKNYTEEITQKEIYTTEKYLYPAAMRAAAIIISPKGADDNAKAAASGALREAGKLIINISTSDLRSMLEKRDRGESGSEVLVHHLDEMLMRIER